MSSGKPVVGPGHRQCRPAAIVGPVVGPVLLGAGAVHPLLDFANAGQVLVELGLIRVADLALQSGGLVLDAVEDAGRPPAFLVVEEAVEGQRRVDLHRHRRVRILPGDVRAVGHREIGLVVAGDRLLASQHQARLCRLLAQMSGQHLIDADAAAQHRSLLQRRSREDVARLTGVDADAGGGFVEQARDDVQPGTQRSQGREALAQLHVRAGAFRPPVLGVDAVAHEQDREPFGRSRGGRAGSGLTRRERNRLQPGEGQRYPYAAEQRAAADLLRLRGHRSSPCFEVSNG